MKTITFYSYKGGVGRSLTLSNIAMRLADLGKKVCIIDFDLEAPGLHQKFDNYILNENISKGIVEYIFDFQESGIIADNVNDFLVNIEYNGILKGSIKLFPAGNIYSNDYWKNLSSIDWKNLFYSENNNGINLLLHLKELIKRDYKPDFILIDSRTGITDISGIAMTLLADEVVTFAANNRENIYGTANIIASLKSPANNLTGNEPKIHFVLSRIPYYSSADRKYIEIEIINKAMNSINEDKKLIDKVFVIHSDRELEEQESFKINRNINNQSGLNSVSIQEDYLILFEELTKGVLTSEEINKFNSIKECELLIEEAKISKDSALKIDKLEKAIELNPYSNEAYSLLASVYNQLNNFNEALKYIDLAIEYSNHNINYRHNKALYLTMLKKHKESKAVLETILSESPKFVPALSLMGTVLYMMKDYDEALNFHLQAHKLSPSANTYNMIGNIYRVLENYELAFEYIYKCLSLNPTDMIGTGTLAEIYAQIGNDDEFYKNLQLSFAFGMTSEIFQRIIDTESIYKKYYSAERFLNLLQNYRIKINFDKR